MDHREESFICEYMDASVRPATDMLYNCVQDPSKGYDFNCRNDVDDVDRKNTSYTDNLSYQRGFVTSGQTEGFTNMFITDNGPGKSTIRNGKCPQGYTRCPKTGRCIQTCIGCSYRDGMKSKDFNEADPCFPQGVYDGLTNDGEIKCACGTNNKYCSDRFTNQFTADGSLFYNQKIKNTLGLTDTVSKLFYFGQL